jgi:hypothetical protein
MIPTCPNCSDPLVPLATDEQTPPWKCSHCLLGWWNGELTTEARAAWRNGVQDFQWESEIAASLHRERQLASMRGTSCTIEHLAYLTRQQRATADSFAHPRAVQFHDAVEAAEQEKP